MVGKKFRDEFESDGFGVVQEKVAKDAYFDNEKPSPAHLTRVCPKMGINQF